MLLGIGLSLLLHGGALAAFLALGEGGPRSPAGMIEVTLIARQVEVSSEPTGPPGEEVAPPVRELSPPAPRPAAGGWDHPAPSSHARVAAERQGALPRPDVKPVLSELLVPADRMAALPQKAGSETPEKGTWEAVAPAPEPERLVDPRPSSALEGTGDRPGAMGARSWLSRVAPAGEGSGLAVSAYAAPRFQVGSLDNPLPVYPPLARRRGIEGRTVLRVEVLPSGESGAVAVWESSGHEILDQAAADAVREWRFAPARVGDNPVRAYVEVPITFRLE